MRALLRGVSALLLIFAAPGILGHGGVSIEDDTCILRIGPYKAHFTGYQPAVRASQEFCEDIPEVHDVIIVLDFIDAPLREMALDFRVVRDVNGAGVDASIEDLGNIADIEAETAHYTPAARYARGNLSINLAFDVAGDFIGIVTARDGKTGPTYTSVFPFSVGKTRWYAGWAWIVMAVLAGALLYGVSGRRNGKGQTAPPSE